MLRLMKRVSDSINRDWMLASILFLFVFPLFFQLSGSIFRSETYFRSQGQLLQLPLPIASIFCFVGIALLLRLEQRHFGMDFVFSLFMAMMLAVVMSTGVSQDLELARFILLIQFILPAFALVLGSLYIPPERWYLRIEAILLYLLLLLIPLQVIATIIQGDVHLAWHLYAFSLYQHLQYLPVIFIAFYLLVLAAFYDSLLMKPLLIFLTPWMGVYLAASIAASAILLAFIGLAMFLIISIRKQKTAYGMLILILFICSFAAYFALNDQSSYYAAKYNQDLSVPTQNLPENLQTKNSYLLRMEGTMLDSLPGNLKERVVYWWYFAEGVFDSKKTLAFGHSVRPDRQFFPSAHNYYLDLAYNFGVIALIPFVFLLAGTAYGCIRVLRTQSVTPDVIFLMFSVGYFIIVDNSLKVGFRQPYPGMIMFFLWGMLLTRLDESRPQRDVST